MIENIPYTADEIKAMVKTIEELRKKYSSALDKASKLRVQNPFDTVGQMVEHIFPELKEDNNDERIRKGLIKAVSRIFEGYKLFDTDVTREEALAWLEKQGEQSVEPKWCHHKVDLSDCSEEYRKAYYDGWNNCNMQHSQCEVESNDNDEEIRKTLIDLVKCNERSGYKLLNNVSTDSMITWLEKQGEPADKVEPKFKVGNWIVFNGLVLYIYEIVDGYYKTVDIDGIPCSYDWAIDNIARLWTINDSNDGDVLVDSYSKDSIIILYNGIYKERTILAHCGWNGYNLSVNTNGFGYGGLDNTNYLPATKEQRDLLFSKMKQEGYEWDDEMKKLSKQTLNVWMIGTMRYMMHLKITHISNYVQSLMRNLDKTVLWVKLKK